MTDIPLHGKKPRLSPAEAFLAEQASHVTPRKAAFERLNLVAEHDAYVPDELRRAAPEGAPAPKQAAPGVNLDVDRPAPDFEMPALPEALDGKPKKREVRSDLPEV